MDSHTFLWALMAPAKLSARVRSELVSARNEVFLSSVSLWEISLKYSLGKLTLEGANPNELLGAAEKAGIELVSMEPQVAATFYQLPRLPHKDPFDRMLIWQCIQGDFTLVSKDADLLHYKPLGLRFMW